MLEIKWKCGACGTDHMGLEGGPCLWRGTWEHPEWIRQYLDLLDYGFPR